MSAVEIRAAAVLSLNPERSGKSIGTPPSDDALNEAVFQCVSDASDGTFGRLPTVSAMSAEVLDVRFDPPVDGGRRRVEFAFALSDGMFPVAAGGLQHLIGCLASDTFPAQTGPCDWHETEVRHVRLSNDMRAAAKFAFRRTARTPLETRDAFALKKGIPLVAFSFKPRVGFSHEAALTTTRKAIEGGVSLVEFDTRNLEEPGRAYSEWVQLALTAAEAGAGQGRVATFAPNLSHASPIAVHFARQWCADRELLEVLKVVKVDGGLDGLSTLQGLRQLLDAEGVRQPIVTSYPLLRRAFRPSLGSDDFWIDVLTISGADIIYPGGRPSFPDEARKVGGDEATGLSNAQRRYRMLSSKEDGPMLTFAAGAHPGQLHVAYELLGPDVAYFLGGAIALHPKGVSAGARLCANILAEAAALAEKAEDDDEPYSQPLNADLIREIESYKVAGGAPFYYTPEFAFADSPLSPYYRV
jgi:ribulose 1,5-bisphosphate carboxylase large subunit-like protein